MYRAGGLDVLMYGSMICSVANFLFPTVFFQSQRFFHVEELILVFFLCREWARPLVSPLPVHLFLDLLSGTISRL